MSKRPCAEELKLVVNSFYEFVGNTHCKTNTIKKRMHKIPNLSDTQQMKKIGNVSELYNDYNDENNAFPYYFFTTPNSNSNNNSNNNNNNNNNCNKSSNFLNISNSNSNNCNRNSNFNNNCASENIDLATQTATKPQVATPTATKTTQATNTATCVKHSCSTTATTTTTLSPTTTLSTSTSSSSPPSTIFSATMKHKRPATICLSQCSRLTTKPPQPASRPSLLFSCQASPTTNSSLIWQPDMPMHQQQQQSSQPQQQHSQQQQQNHFQRQQQRLSQQFPNFLPNPTLLPRSPLSFSPASSDGPSKILNYLYLGSQSDVASEEVMKGYGITHVLNITKDIPRPNHIPEAKFLRVSANDTQFDQLLPYFNDVFLFIEEAHRNGGLVLVHCMAGISRSSTVVIAFLMNKYNMTFNDAYKFVKQRRPSISPNFSFLGQLLEFEKYLVAKRQAAVAMTTAAGINNVTVASAGTTADVTAVVTTAAAGVNEDGSFDSVGSDGDSKKNNNNNDNNIFNINNNISNNNHNNNCLNNNSNNVASTSQHHDNNSSSLPTATMITTTTAESELNDDDGEDDDYLEIKKFITATLNIKSTTATSFPTSTANILPTSTTTTTITFPTTSQQQQQQHTLLTPQLSSMLSLIPSAQHQQQQQQHQQQHQHQLQQHLQQHQHRRHHSQQQQHQQRQHFSLSSPTSTTSSDIPIPNLDLNDDKPREYLFSCRTRSLNQSNSSLSSMGSLENIEIVQVS